jgi:hypothetical protein
VRARAACRAVGRVRVDQARALAADGEAGAVERPLERGWAVRAEVDRAVRDAAALVVVDAHGEVVPVDERDVVVVVAVRGRERELGERRGRDARAGVRVADEAAVAAAVEARVRAVVVGEVAVTTGLKRGQTARCTNKTPSAYPDTASTPVVRDGERDGRVRVLCPAGGLRRHGVADVQVSEHLRKR